MLRLFSFIPMVRDTIRVKDIRTFVDSPSGLADIDTFLSLMTRYQLLDGVEGDELIEVKLDISFEHIGDFIDHLELNLIPLSEGLPPTNYSKRKHFEGSLLTWLKSERGHYVPKQAFDRLYDSLRNYDVALVEVMQDRSPETLGRVLGPVSVTLRGIVAALAAYHFDMTFEGDFA